MDQELNLDRIQVSHLSAWSSFLQSLTQSAQTTHSRHAAYVNQINGEMNAWTDVGQVDADGMVSLVLIYNCLITIVLEQCFVFHVFMSSFSFLLYSVPLYFSNWWFFVYLEVTDSYIQLTY